MPGAGGDCGLPSGIATAAALSLWETNESAPHFCGRRRRDADAGLWKSTTMAIRPVRPLPDKSVPLPTLRQLAEEVELLRRAQAAYAQSPSPERGTRVKLLGHKLDLRVAAILRSAEDPPLRGGLES